MKTYKGLGGVPAGFGPSAVTIGKFDGVHQGHRAVIGRLRSIAEAEGLRSAVVTFTESFVNLVADCGGWRWVPCSCWVMSTSRPSYTNDHGGRAEWAT